MSERFITLGLRHDGLAFELVGNLVVTTSYQQICVRKPNSFCLYDLSYIDQIIDGKKINQREGLNERYIRFFCLFDGASMTEVEQIEDAISVDSNGPIWSCFWNFVVTVNGHWNFLSEFSSFFWIGFFFFKCVFVPIFLSGFPSNRAIFLNWLLSFFSVYTFYDFSILHLFWICIKINNNVGDPYWF